MQMLKRQLRQSVEAKQIARERQTFHDTSRLSAKGDRFSARGTQSFHENSPLSGSRLSARDSQSFHEKSRLSARDSQSFHEKSRLSGRHSQSFHENSRLSANSNQSLVDRTPGGGARYRGQNLSMTQRKQPTGKRCHPSSNEHAHPNANPCPALNILAFAALARRDWFGLRESLRQTDVMAKTMSAAANDVCIQIFVCACHAYIYICRPVYRSGR